MGVHGSADPVASGAMEGSRHIWDMLCREHQQAWVMLQRWEAMGWGGKRCPSRASTVHRRRLLAPRDLAENSAVLF